MSLDACYRCLTCDEKRPYGNGIPEDRTFEPLIQCCYCGKMTRHKFEAVEPHVQVRGLRSEGIQ